MEFPVEHIFTVKNGDWRCGLCKEPMGVVISIDLIIHIPDSCPHADSCRLGVMAIIDLHLATLANKKAPN